MPFVPVVYSGGAPVLSSGGAQRVACTHLAEWLQVYDALQVARGRGHVAYLQTMGGADASAGTHTCGSAWDAAYTGNAPILDAREMGAAVWPRLRRLGWVGGEHVHGLISCGDNGCNAYQYTAYWLGYNGLGQGGYGAGDPLPKPSRRRNWREGIVWARAEIARLTAAPPQEEEDDMDMFRLVEAAYEHHFGREASRDEVNTHVLGAVAAGSTPAELYLSLAKSPEARDPQIRHDRIAGYYVTYLGRPGAETADEILGWANSAKALGEIRALIAGSAEATLYAQQQEA